MNWERSSDFIVGEMVWSSMTFRSRTIQWFGKFILQRWFSLPIVITPSVIQRQEKDKPVRQKKKTTIISFIINGICWNRKCFYLILFKCPSEHQHQSGWHDNFCQNIDLTQHFYWYRYYVWSFYISIYPLYCEYCWVYCIAFVRII